MKFEKICPYCGKKFVTDRNTRKFCRQACARHWRKRERSGHTGGKRYLCQWCAKHFFAKRKVCFCCDECHSKYMSVQGIYSKKITSLRFKITLTDAESGARKEGITYGKYIAIHKIR